MKRRCGKINKHLNFAARIFIQFLYRVNSIKTAGKEILIVKDIFADREAKVHSLVIKNSALAARFEIPGLVKDIVKRQKPFPCRKKNFFIFKQDCGIMKRFTRGCSVGSDHANDDADSCYA